MHITYIEKLLTCRNFPKNIAYAKKLEIWSRYSSLFRMFMQIFLGFSIPFTGCLCVFLFTSNGGITAIMPVLISAGIIYPVVFLYLFYFFYTTFNKHFLSYLYKNNLTESFVVYHEKETLNDSVKTQLPAVKKKERL